MAVACRRSLGGALAGLCLTGVSAGSVEACQPPPANMSLLEAGKSVLPEKQQEALLVYLARFRNVDPKCTRIDVKAYASDGERAANPRLAQARSVAISRALVADGFLSENIKVSDAGKFGRNDEDPSARSAETSADWNWTLGRMRCDPATELPLDTPATTCGPVRFRICYLELKDGTICNISNVPNPSPAKYSVVSDGQGNWIDQNGKRLPNR